MRFTDGARAHQMTGQGQLPHLSDHTTGHGIASSRGEQLCSASQLNPQQGGECSQTTMPTDLAADALPSHRGCR